jgi:hypothetical protein
MPVLRFPHIPTRFASGGRLTICVGQSDPSTRQRHPRYPWPPAEAGSLSLAVASVGRAARGYPRDSSPFCHKQAKTASG